MIVMNSQKQTARASKLNDQRKTSIEINNNFSILSPDENPTDLMGKDSSLDDVCERSIQIDDIRY